MLDLSFFSPMRASLSNIPLIVRFSASLVTGGINSSRSAVQRLIAYLLSRIPANLRTGKSTDVSARIRARAAPKPNERVRIYDLKYEAILTLDALVRDLPSV